VRLLLQKGPRATEIKPSASGFTYIVFLGKYPAPTPKPSAAGTLGAMGTAATALKARLDALCRQYDTPPALVQDPLSVPLTYAAPLDREVAAFVAAHLAYGRVAPMIRAVRAALAPLGAHPADWLRQRTPVEAARELTLGFGAWCWRFHTAPDLVAWLLAWQRLDQESGQGLEPHLAPRKGEAADLTLSRLVQRLRLELPPTYGSRFSLPDPLEGAACKRWRMFLRWLVRSGWPDLGQWTSLSPSTLVIPLDTHVARVSRFIGLTSRATPDGRMAQEITTALARLDAADPLRYDFALSHLGILGDCPGLRQRSTCGGCALYTVCRAGSKSAAPIWR